jgi:hypothetical protein
MSRFTQKFFPFFIPLTHSRKKMPEAIPPILAPFLDRSTSAPSLNLVTSTLSTPAHWVLLRYIYAALNSAAERRPTIEAAMTAPALQRVVVLVSLLRSQDLWLELGRKIVSHLKRDILDLLMP